MRVDVDAERLLWLRVGGDAFERVRGAAPGQRSIGDTNACDLRLRSVRRERKTRRCTNARSSFTHWQRCCWAPR